jgi:hypothetical protein
MLFTFKRDDEGRERIYVGDVCVAKCMPLCTRLDGEYLPVQDVPGVDGEMIVDAIERAGEAGFWEEEPHEDMHGWRVKWKRPSEVTVDVPVADSTVLSVTTEEDES